MFDPSFLHVMIMMDLKSSRRSSEDDDLATAGSTPVGSASACCGLRIHGLVVTSDVTKRDLHVMTEASQLQSYARTDIRRHQLRHHGFRAARRSTAGDGRGMAGSSPVGSASKSTWGDSSVEEQQG